MERGSGAQDLLERLVSEGRVVPPGVDGPFPKAQVSGDPTIDTADAISKARDEER